MLPENIIGREGKKSRMAPKARPAKIVESDVPVEEMGGKPNQFRPDVQPARKPPGPRPAKKN